MKKRLFGIFVSFIVVLIAIGITSSASTEDIPEAVWGTSATDLGGDGRQGYLHDALDAAEADPAITYIKLNTDAYGQQYYRIDGGSFTLDLNGHTVNTVSGTSAFTIYGGDINFTSTQPGALIALETIGGGISLHNDAKAYVDNLTIRTTATSIYSYDESELTLGENASVYSDYYDCIHAGGARVTVKGSLNCADTDYYTIFILDNCITDLTEAKNKGDIVLQFDDVCDLPMAELILVAEGDVIVDRDTKTPDEYPESYVYYEFLVRYDVSFDPAGGSGAMEPVNVLGDSEITLPDSGFTAPSGKKFAGWAVKDDETSERYLAGETFYVSEDVTLSAVWVDDAIFVGGVRLADGKYLAVGADTATDTKPEGGYAYYKDGVLTLDNYTYTGVGYLFFSEEVLLYNEETEEDYPVTYSYNALVYADFGIDIRVVGESSLVSSYYATPETTPLFSYYAGITIEGNRLDISGGALTISSVNDGAINLVNGGDLTVTDATLTLNALEATLDSDGIDINGEGSLTVKNSTLAITTTEDAVELEYGGYVTVSDSTVRITAGDDGIEIDDYGTITIERSTLTASCDYVPLKSDDEVYIVITDSTLDLTSKEDEGIATCHDVYVTGSDVKVSAKLIGIYTDHTFNCVKSTLAVTSEISEGIYVYSAFIAESDVTVTSDMDALYVYSLVVTGESTRLSLTSETAALSSVCPPYFDSGIDLGGKVIESTDPVGNPCFSLAGADGNAAKTLTVSPVLDTPEKKGIGAGAAALITALSLLALEALAAAVVYILVLKPRGITPKSLFSKKSDTPAPTADGTDTDATAESTPTA